MRTQEDFKKVIAVAFEYSYLHDDWVNPLENALAGVTVEQALWRPAPGSKGIWEIVLHLAAWNENMVERRRCKLERNGHERANGPRDQCARGDRPLSFCRHGRRRGFDVERLWNSLDSVREMIESTSLEAIEQGPYGAGDLLCRFIHNGYHLGQITKMRECMGV